MWILDQKLNNVDANNSQRQCSLTLPNEVERVESKELQCSKQFLVKHTIVLILLGHEPFKIYFHFPQ